MWMIAQPADAIGRLTRHFSARDTIHDMGGGIESRKRRRIVNRTIAFVIAGAFVNVAVAWVSASMNRPLPRALPLSKEEAASAMPVRQLSSESPLIEITGNRAASFGRACDVLLAFHREMTDEGQIRYANQITVVRAGWPCYSVYGWTGVGRTPSETGTHGLWRARWMSDVGLTQLRARGLPIIPALPEFLANTALYASAIFGIHLLMFAAPLLMRKRRRIKRGLCFKCAYDLRGNASPTLHDRCPECGTIGASRIHLVSSEASETGPPRGAAP